MLGQLSGVRQQQELPQQQFSEPSGSGAIGGGALAAALVEAAG